jgi:hypothetical protein
MHFHLLRWYLWIAPDVLVGICLLGLLRTRRQRQLPIFAIYLGLEFSLFLTLITIEGLVFKSLLARNIYDWVNTVGSALVTTLELCVLFELANELIISRSSSAQVLRTVLRWTGALLLIVAAGVSPLFSQSGLRRVMKTFQTVDFSLNLIIIGLLLALLLFSRVLQISWRSLPTGIALGFGVYASAEIAASSLLSLLGRPGYVTVDLVRMAAFHMCVVVWSVYIFFRPEAPASPAKGLKKLELETWDHQLERMVHPWSRP